MASLIKKHPVFEALKLKLEKELISALKTFELNKKTNETITLYHYTDLYGLKGIIEKQYFFSSNSAYLNDKEEFYYGVKLFKDALSEYMVENDSDERDIINEVSNELNNRSESYHYVTCFSLEGDLLSQWRAYANDGKGIAIGFNLKKLIEAFEPKALGLLIEYDAENQKKIANVIVRKTIQFYSTNLKILKPIISENLNKMIADEVNEVFNEYIGQFKHNAFEEEREYRFDLSIDKDINKDRELFYRVGNNNLLVPYLYLKTNYQEETNKKGKIKQLPINELIIGPSLDYDLNKKSILGFLKKNDYPTDIRIKQSKVPYRI